VSASFADLIFDAANTGKCYRIFGVSVCKSERRAQTLLAARRVPPTVLFEMASSGEICPNSRQFRAL
ncbi:MAG TPA: hypothetical protein VMB26_11150, partial [Candidatus Binataceae bacterium]|nr:hypothetical protein [Candidatus Binataceae bacterium]